MLGSDDKEILKLASSVMCNLLLEFSPSKNDMLCEGIVHRLVEVIQCEDNSVRIDAVWALMNISYQASAKVREEIVTALGILKLVSSVLMLDCCRILMGKSW
eukprot:m.252364 g.252364  ORF g.252364 m.252364 type:complete len:102 (+) comp40351_c0_seq41:347-652(+)